MDRPGELQCRTARLLSCRNFRPFLIRPSKNWELVGDRRTAALVAADGTLSWMCLPNYDGPTVFGGLLDTTAGGSWKFGPKARRFGRQLYPWSGPILQTTWHDLSGSLELLDFMPLPQDNRKSADDGRRILVRRLRCTRGLVHCRMVLQPRDDFEQPLEAARHTKHSAVFRGPAPLGFWSSKPMDPAADRIEGEFTVTAGEELWCVFGPDEHKAEWTTRAAAELLQATIEYWNAWTAAIDFRGPRRGQSTLWQCWFISSPSPRRERSSPRPQHRCRNALAATETTIIATPG